MNKLFASFVCLFLDHDMHQPRVGAVRCRRCHQRETLQVQHL